MLTALRGTLVSEYFAEHLLADRFAGHLGEGDRDSARRALDRVRRACASLGPASGVRAVFDVGAVALAGMLGFRVAQVTPFARAGRRRTSSDEAATDLATVLERGSARVAMLVVAWGDDLDAAWRDTIRVGIEFGVRWCLLFNARQLRLVDSSRSYGRDHLEFDLDATCEDAASFELFWAMLRAEAFAPTAVGEPKEPPYACSAGLEARGSSTCLLEEIVALSAQHGIGVCRSLREGVLEALAALTQGFVDAGAPLAANAPPNPPLPVLFEQSLTIIYRILFLLFAEARRLVPTWHPVYRDAYSIETLRALAEEPDPRAVVGAWETLQAISRLAHRGCHAGSLVVTPFNGRLFSPARTPLAESGRLDDGVARQTIMALSTHDAGAGRNRARIAYRDLGVEQLGAVYESVLDYEPRIEDCGTAGRAGSPTRQPGAPNAATALGWEARWGALQPGGCARQPKAIVRLERGSGRRKATGTFYTPHSLTGYLVRRTLHPLVEHASADEILGFRILDPAMGSGAFLVAACHYLAARYERALVAEGQRHASDVDERDRAMFRRSIAQRCLFGVDLNPMAVQLARLSLWLATLAADCPLTFLDHHLTAGDSLVGASLFDVLRYPSRRGARQPCAPAEGRVKAESQPSLFDADQLRADLEQVLPERLRVGIEPGDTLAAVQDKERAIQRLARPDGALARWRDVANLWCACWFWGEAAVPARGVYQDLVNSLVGRRASLPESSLLALLAHARAVASGRTFLHWQLEFPEVFFDAAGRPLVNAGFDAVIGNPPWDMLRADADEAGAREEKAYDRSLAQFARRSGIYTAQSDGHPNRFQLFVERAFHLARPGGRIGLVAPWGLLADRGCSRLRRLLFHRADTDSVVGFDNTKAVFPIHRSVRFALVTTTTGRPTGRTLCRFGEKDVASLDGLPDAVDDRSRETLYPILLSPALLVRLSGDDLAVPDIRSPIDLEILERTSSAFPWLSAPDGWCAHFGRELNASDDRHHFLEGGAGLPVVEGKHLEPFVAHLARARFRIPAPVASRLLAGNRSFRRWRLAYRDVASATNRVTLIAAILPPDCVTTHTVFCLKTALDEDAQWFLCGVMNSYVANYLVRLRVTTHVSAGIVERLPAPLVPTDVGLGAAIATASRQMAARMRGTGDHRLQALVARLYDLTAEQFSHVLETFPLVEQERRDGAFEEFLRLRREPPV